MVRYVAETSRRCYALIFRILCPRDANAIFLVLILAYFYMIGTFTDRGVIAYQVLNVMHIASQELAAK